MGAKIRGSIHASFVTSQFSDTKRNEGGIVLENGGRVLIVTGASVAM